MKLQGLLEVSINKVSMPELKKAIIKHYESKLGKEKAIKLLNRMKANPSTPGIKNFKYKINNLDFNAASAKYEQLLRKASESIIRAKTNKTDPDVETAGKFWLGVLDDFEKKFLDKYGDEFVNYITKNT